MEDTSLRQPSSSGCSFSTPPRLCQLPSGSLHQLTPSLLVELVAQVSGHDRHVRRADALLAKSVLVCEGASEVGLMRGLDLSRQAANLPSLMALGTALVDGGGDRCFERARQFQQMGYRTALLRDSDVAVHADIEAAFRAGGGSVFSWAPGNALEDELFNSLDPASLVRMIDLAIELREDSLVDAHIRTASRSNRDTATVRGVLAFGMASAEDRAILGRASRLSRGWYKNVTAMEMVGRDIVGPGFNLSAPPLQAALNAIFHWCAGA